jgi:hypothetical protein
LEAQTNMNNRFDLFLLLIYGLALIIIPTLYLVWNNHTAGYVLLIGLIALIISSKRISEI